MTKFCRRENFFSRLRVIRWMKNVLRYNVVTAYRSIFGYFYLRSWYEFYIP